LEGDDLTLLKEIGTALKSPVWTLSLGRKSYPLALPPYLPTDEPWGGSLKEGVSLEDALKTVPYLRLLPDEREKPPGATLTVEKEGGSITLADNPISYRYRARSFAPRHAETESIDFAHPEILPCIFPA
jgi:CRISPR system Cascade subunit CasD